MHISKPKIYKKKFYVSLRKDFILDIKIDFFK